jgi:hypothetical protein
MQVTWESVALVVGAFGGPTIFLATFGKGFFVEYVAPRVKLEIQAYLKSTDFIDTDDSFTERVYFACQLY